MPETGGLVTTEEYQTGTPQSGEYGSAGQSPNTESGAYGPDYSVFDPWFAQKPFNREDVIVAAAIVSVAILACTEMR